MQLVLWTISLWWTSPTTIKWMIDFVFFVFVDRRKTKLGWFLWQNSRQSFASSFDAESLNERWKTRRQIARAENLNESIKENRLLKAQEKRNWFRWSLNWKLKQLGKSVEHRMRQRRRKIESKTNDSSFLVTDGTRSRYPSMKSSRKDLFFNWELFDASFRRTEILIRINGAQRKWFSWISNVDQCILWFRWDLILALCQWFCWLSVVSRRWFLFFSSNRFNCTWLNANAEQSFLTMRETWTSFP